MSLPNGESHLAALAFVAATTGDGGDLHAWPRSPHRVPERRFADGATSEPDTRKLEVLWSLDLFLHNGSIDSLEALLCLNGPRPTIEQEPFSDRGHEFGCAAPVADREALVDYLRSL